MLWWVAHVIPQNAVPGTTLMIDVPPPGTSLGAAAEEGALRQMQMVVPQGATPGMM